MTDRRTDGQTFVNVESLSRLKKIAEKETLVHMGGRGVKIIPFF